MWKAVHPKGILAGPPVCTSTVSLLECTRKQVGQRFMMHCCLIHSSPPTDTRVASQLGQWNKLKLLLQHMQLETPGFSAPSSCFREATVHELCPTCRSTEETEEACRMILRRAWSKAKQEVDLPTVVFVL